MLPCSRAARLAQFREWRQWRDVLRDLYKATMQAKSDGHMGLYNILGMVGKAHLEIQPPKPRRRKPRPKCMRPLRKEVPA